VLVLCWRPAHMALCSCLEMPACLDSVACVSGQSALFRAGRWQNTTRCTCMARNTCGDTVDVMYFFMICRVPYAMSTRGPVPSRLTKK
jgi:hypothetical protein